MGQAIINSAADSKDIQIVAGIDINASSLAAAYPFPIFEKISDFPSRADVIVDFSHHTAVSSLLQYAVSTGTPLVLATTGHTEEELAEIEAEAEKVSIFRSGNMSIGINLLIELCREASKTLGESFDIEITEKHHNQKLDAPSGTAIMIANALSETREETEYVYDRQSVRKKREPKEIGIHSVRGGTIVGEHEVLFAGNNEMITLTHTATSREIFATGAIKAAIYLAKKANTTGLYNMSDLINNR
jgi:4-hydroxy-tetrahydrodipicolinate reductase